MQIFASCTRQVGGYVAASLLLLGFWGGCSHRQQRTNSSTSSQVENAESNDGEEASDDAEEASQEDPDPCAAIEDYSARLREDDGGSSEPRVLTADELSISGDNSTRVVLHTREESVATHDEWGAFAARVAGHLNYSVKGEPYVELDGRDAESRESPIRELADLLEECDIERGLFHGLGDAIVGDDRVHLFECAPGMAPVSRDLALEAGPAPNTLRAAWRIDRVIVRCNYPKLNVEFLPNDATNLPEELLAEEQLPSRVRRRLAEALEASKSGEDVAWSERAFDHYPLVQRLFYLEPLDRFWRANRILAYRGHVVCKNPEGRDCPDKRTEYRNPDVYRHWYYRSDAE